MEQVYMQKKFKKQSVLEIKQEISLWVGIKYFFF
jgi:hypothetical protein